MPEAAVAILAVVLGLIALAVVAFVGWILPITLGLRVARRKNYSPAWMLFGIHPVGGWVAYIALSCQTPRIQCPTCGGFVKVNFRVCPYCHNEIQPVANVRQMG